jgi:hypothetical protein
MLYFQLRGLSKSVSFIARRQAFVKQNLRRASIASSVQAIRAKSGKFLTSTCQRVNNFT